MKEPDKLSPSFFPSCCAVKTSAGEVPYKTVPRTEGRWDVVFVCLFVIVASGGCDVIETDLGMIV